MRRNVVRLGLALVAASSLMGCSAAYVQSGFGASSAPYRQQSAWRSMGTSQPHADVYIINWWHPTVLGYARTGGKPVITLQGLIYPLGLAVDATGNVYVTDQNFVDVFAPRSTHPFSTIQESTDEQPYHLAVDSGGNVWVGNVMPRRTGNLQEYSSTGSLIQTILCPKIKDYSGAVATDGTGNVFIQSGSAQGAPVVDEVASGTNSCMRLPPRFSTPGGLALTASGNLVVGDHTNYDAFTYAAPDFSKIVARTNLGGGNRKGASFEVAISLTKANDGIWTANYAGPQGDGITLYRYPHGGIRPLAKIKTDFGLATNVAADY